MGFGRRVPPKARKCEGRSSAQPPAHPTEDEGRPRYDPVNVPDRAAVWRVMVVRSFDQGVEYLRINLYLGAPVILHALAWALAANELYPIPTVHGSKNPEFMQDSTVWSAAGPRAPCTAQKTTS